MNRQSRTLLQTPVATKVLLLTITNRNKEIIKADTLREICDKEGFSIQRVALFFKNNLLQAFVEFESENVAVEVKRKLDNCDIYPGVCTLKIEHSPALCVPVRLNGDMSYNITLDKSGPKPLSYTEGSQLVNGNNKRYNSFPASDPPPAKQMLSNDREPQQRIPNMFSSQNKEIPAANVQEPQPSLASNFSSPNAKSFNTAEETAKSKQLYQDLSQNAMNSDGGEGCVTMVFGLHNRIVNCGHLFNLFSCYGDVIKVLILTKENNPSCAMIQYKNKLSSEKAVEHFHEFSLFDHKLQVSVSKHKIVPEPSNISKLFDGTLSFVDYRLSYFNRFKCELNVPVNVSFPDCFWTLKPSRILSYSSAPPDCTKNDLLTMFQVYETEKPSQISDCVRDYTLGCSGWIEFSSPVKAAEALALVNNVSLYKNMKYIEVKNPKPTGTLFTLKLSFSSASLS